MLRLVRNLLYLKKEVHKKDKEKGMVEKVIFNDYDISETFNKFFANIVPNMKTIPSENFKTTFEYKTENPVQSRINKFKNHPSTKMTISKINPNKRFLFAQFRTMKF